MADRILDVSGGGGDGVRGRVAMLRILQADLAAALSPPGANPGLCARERPCSVFSLPPLMRRP